MFFVPLSNSSAKKHNLYSNSIYHDAWPLTHFIFTCLWQSTQYVHSEPQNLRYSLDPYAEVKHINKYDLFKIIITYRCLCVCDWNGKCIFWRLLMCNLFAFFCLSSRHRMMAGNQHSRYIRTSESSIKYSWIYWDEAEGDCFLKSWEQLPNEML